MTWKMCSSNGPALGIRAESVMGIPMESVGHFTVRVIWV